MTKICTKCGDKLSFFESLSNSLCSSCRTQIKLEEESVKLEIINRIERIKQEVIGTKSINPQQIEILKNQGKANLINLYSALLIEFESDGELDKNELETLQQLQESLNLTNEEVKFEQRVMPYHYVYMIRNEGKLPNVKFGLVRGVSNPIIKKGEQVHFSSPVVLKEMQTTSLGYQGGSSGVSLRVMKGVNYRVGSSRGHVKKVQKWVATSTGQLMITNKRVFLHPFPGSKPINIPINKILSYNCFENGVEIYKDGREKGYFFETKNTSAPEIIGMCLGFLCENL
jgi:hypothetical protein